MKNKTEKTREKLSAPPFRAARSPTSFLMFNADKKKKMGVALTCWSLFPLVVGCIVLG